MQLKLAKKEKSLSLTQQPGEQSPEQLREEFERETVIKFADWLLSLSPSQKVSLWSKDGQLSGIFTMDGEQLLDRFIRSEQKLKKG